MNYNIRASYDESIYHIRSDTMDKYSTMSSDHLVRFYSVSTESDLNLVLYDMTRLYKESYFSSNSIYIGPDTYSCSFRELPRYSPKRGMRVRQRSGDYKINAESLDELLDSMSKKIIIIRDFLDSLAFYDKGNRRLINYLMKIFNSPHDFILMYNRSDLEEIYNENSSRLFKSVDRSGTKVIGSLLRASVFCQKFDGFNKELTPDPVIIPQ